MHSLARLSGFSRKKENSDGFFFLLYFPEDKP
jgi:hypothetical protein